MKPLAQSLWTDESAQAQVEYGLVIALVAIGLVATLVLFKDKLVAMFDRIGTAVDAAAK